MRPRDRSRWVWLAPGFTLLLLLVACQGASVEPGPNAVPETTATVTSSAASTPRRVSDQEKQYRVLVDEVINGTGQLARIISSTSISIASNPQGASKARSTVEGVIGSLELGRDRLEGAELPPGYENLHQTLLDALSFYTQASEALLPDSQTGQANYPRFQELMLQGGKNFHAAGAESSDLTRP